MISSEMEMVELQIVDWRFIIAELEVSIWRCQVRREEFSEMGDDEGVIIMDRRINRILFVRSSIMRQVDLRERGI